MDGIASVNGSHKPPYLWADKGDGVAIVYRPDGSELRRFFGRGAAIRAEKYRDELLEAFFEGQWVLRKQLETAK